MSGHAAPRVLVVCDAVSPPEALAHALAREGLEPCLERGVLAACSRLRTERFAAVAADLGSPNTEALALLRAAHRSAPRSPVVVRFRSHSGAASTLAAVRSRAFAVLSPSTPAAALVAHVVRAADAARARDATPRGGEPSPADRAEVAPSTRLSAVLRPLSAVASAESATDLEGVRWLIASAARDAVAAEVAWVFAWEGEDTVIERAGPDLEAPEAFALEARLAGRPIVRRPDAAGRTFAGVSAMVDAETVAVLLVACREGSTVTRDGVALLEAFAQQLGLAEHRVRMRRQLDSTIEAVITAFWNALALRDIDTAAHSQRVGETAVRLALAAGMRAGSRELEEIRVAALLHDVGKIGVPDAILRKRGALDDDEWLEMRRHPDYGHRVMQGIPLLAGAAALIRASHEHWDGSGYPAGLREEAIPLGARIFAIADAWDAMTSDRPYRRAMRDAAALEELRQYAGAQFDPRLVAAFERVVGAWGHRPVANARVA